MYLFFPHQGYTPLDAFSGWFTPKDALSNGAIAAVVAAVWLASRPRVWQQFQQRLALSQSLQAGTGYHRFSVAIMSALTLAASLAVTVYFVHRIDYVLEDRGIVGPLDGSKPRELLITRSQWAEIKDRMENT